MHRQSREQPEQGRREREDDDATTGKKKGGWRRKSTHGRWAPRRGGADRARRPRPTWARARPAARRDAAVGLRQGRGHQPTTDGRARLGETSCVVVWRVAVGLRLCEGDRGTRQPAPTPSNKGRANWATPTPAGMPYLPSQTASEANCRSRELCGAAFGSSIMTTADTAGILKTGMAAVLASFFFLEAFPSANSTHLARTVFFSKAVQSNLKRSDMNICTQTIFIRTIHSLLDHTEEESEGRKKKCPPLTIGWVAFVV